MRQGEDSLQQNEDIYIEMPRKWDQTASVVCTADLEPRAVVAVDLAPRLWCVFVNSIR